MNSKNLKTLLCQSQTEVVFDPLQKVLFIPPRIEKVDSKQSFEKLFPNFDSIHIEYCSGNGQWIYEKALKNPHILWIAVEMQLKRTRQILWKREQAQLENLFITCGEALEFTSYYLEPESVDEVYINFPDPWPKRRHAKFRLIQMPFIQELARILKKGGSVHFLTDDPAYSSQTIAAFLKEENSFCPSLPPPFYHSEVQDYGSSFFMSLWEEKKRGFYFSKFQKKCKYKT